MFLFLTFFLFSLASTRETYTLSLHDALPILVLGVVENLVPTAPWHGGRQWIGTGWTDVVAFLVLVLVLVVRPTGILGERLDRKSTRLNSSHRCISYAVFCLKKKINIRHRPWF